MINLKAKMLFVLILFMLSYGCASQETLDYQQAGKIDAVEAYDRFLKKYPQTERKDEILYRMERLCYEKAIKTKSIAPYKQFLLKYPVRIAPEVIAERIEQLQYVYAENANTLQALNHFLNMYPKTRHRTKAENKIRWIRQSRKLPVITYSKKNSSRKKQTKINKNDVSIYQKNPLHNASKQITYISDLSKADLMKAADKYYQNFMKTHDHPNAELERFYRFAITWNTISWLRYKRRVEGLPSQKKIPDLIDHVLRSRWYKEFMIKITENQKYEYMENQALQIYLAQHTAAHFFQLPFPTFLCLLFQESKFDFKIASHTGAVGLGQLTTVGMQQVNILRQKDLHELRLQAATIHLGNIYRDPVVLEIMKEMGFSPKFPDIERMPEPGTYKTPDTLSKQIIKETSKQLLKRGYKFGKNINLVRSLCKKVRRGTMLPDKYAAVHPVYSKVLEKKYGNDIGNVFNPESNLMFSAMLLKYYFDYSWKVNRKILRLQPDVRAIAAIASYNVGQGGTLGFLRILARDYPKLNMNKASVEELEDKFTIKRVKRNHRKNPAKAQEIFRHVLKIKDCACAESSS